MLSMPGKNNFGSRFNPYRWSAPVYENPDELIEAIQSARFLSKRLKSVRVIGEARPCFKTKRAGSAPLDETRVNCFEAREPFIFDFEDGSSLEFWPQGRDYVRMACSSIPNRIENGLSFNTPTFEEFFISVLGENWQGYELKDFEVVRIKHKAVVTSLIKGKIKEDIVISLKYANGLRNGANSDTHRCKQLTEHGEERCIKLREVAGFSAVRTIFQIVGPRKILHCLLGK